MQKEKKGHDWIKIKEHKFNFIFYRAEKVTVVVNATGVCLPYFDCWKTNVLAHIKKSTPDSTVVSTDLTRD